ncbi:MAG: zf-HC2 domain-containing protein [Gemmatimonadetes bacterium]|nr:zf-HC2 domain-containing protein [Gemmatimonadota bacterium]MDA1103160.1 zf-HC2 domain-containing protein [Gemmatimonadota bacterium]
MLHVDEGALHAYLDGALDEYPAAEAERVREHLDGCAECAARLAVERSIRSDAAAMLGLAAPDVEMPSFEELRAYVRTTRPPQQAASVRIYRLGWAASVVLALGAGWMVRDGQLQPIQRGNAGQLEESALRPARQQAEQGASADVDEVAAEAAQIVEAERDGRRSEVAAAGGVSVVSAPTVAEPPATRADLPADVVAKVSALDEGPPLSVKDEPDPSVDDLERGVGALTSLADADQMAGRSADLQPLTLEASRESVDAIRSGDSLGLGEVIATAVPAAPQDAPRAEPNLAAERRRAESLVPVTSAISQGTAATGRAVNEYQREEDEPSLVVPGYPVLTVTNLGDGTSPLGVHVVQSLEGGEILELFHLPPGVDPSLVLPPTEGRNEIRMPVGEGWVVIQGPRTEGELRALFESLFAEG